MKRFCLLVVFALGLSFQSATPQQLSAEEQAEADVYFAERERWAMEFLGILEDAKTNGIDGFPDVVSWMTPSLDWNWTIIVFENARGQWAARRMRYVHEEGVLTDWAEHENCGALMHSLEALEDVPPPPIDLQGVGPTPREFVIMADGAGFGVQARLSIQAPFLPYGKIKLTSNYDTPLADWFLDMQENMGSCWSDEQPVIEWRASPAGNTP